jgi:site-specific DNA-cytosine methylase
MRAGTLFSGIGAPECAMPSIDWRWCADIDPFACAVHRARFPGVPNLGDVTRLSADAIEPVDLIVFGSPCQSFSVAGKRLGLDDPRGNLTLVGISLISKLKPRYVVWENVPGVLSDDDGKTIQTVIDLFTQIGYVCDIDVWDAQHFGVPQRRRRVFVTCVLLDDLTKQRTSISERIMGDLLAQALLATWGAALAAWSPEPGHSAFASRTELPAGSLQKKMRSFDALLGGSAVTRLLGFWDGSLAPCTEEPPNSGSTSLLRRERPKPASRTGIAGFPSPEPMGSGDGDRNIGLSLRAIWEDFWHRVSGPTTSTSTDSITSREICSFARLSLSIVQSIISSPDCSLSRPWSSDFWSLAFSSLRLAEDVIDYARSASCELFSPPKLRADWGDNLDAARSCYDLIERRIGGWATPGQIFSFAKSLRGDTAPRREAGERVAASLTHGVDSGGKGGYAGRRREDDTNLVAFGIDSDCFDRSGEGVDGTPGQRSGLGIQEECSSALRSKRPNAGTIGGNRQSGPLEVATAVNAHGGPHGRLDFESETFVTHSLRADGFDASEDGTGRGTPLIPIDMRQASRGEKITNNRTNGSGGAPGHGVGDEGDAAFTVSERGQAVAFESRFARNGRGAPSDFVPPLKAQSGQSGKGDSAPLLQNGMTVRRLTPLEGERLQGLPDNWTLVPYRGKPAADGPRYRAIGNSMAVPVLKWILDRLVHCDEVIRGSAGHRLRDASGIGGNAICARPSGVVWVPSGCAVHAVDHGVEHMRDVAQTMRGRANVVRG